MFHLKYAFSSFQILSVSIYYNNLNNFVYIIISQQEVLRLAADDTEISSIWTFVHPSAVATSDILRQLLWNKHGCTIYRQVYVVCWSHRITIKRYKTFFRPRLKKYRQPTLMRCNSEVKKSLRYGNDSDNVYITPKCIFICQYVPDVKLKCLIFVLKI